MVARRRADVGLCGPKVLAVKGRQELVVDGKHDHSERAVDAGHGVHSTNHAAASVLTQRDFQPFPNFNFASMASTRCHTAVTPSTWPCESLPGAGGGRAPVVSDK